jgi:hypothetical protein
MRQRKALQLEAIDLPAISSEHFWFHSIVGEGI